MILLILQTGEENVLSWERFRNVGFSKTYNTDYQVADSAGTASAFMTGVKTKAGMNGSTFYNNIAALMRCSYCNILTHIVNLILYTSLSKLRFQLLRFLLDSKTFEAFFVFLRLRWKYAK